MTPGHGEHAAGAVEGLLGSRVARLVAAHVPAKRYLATEDPHLALSAGGARTLGCQGVPTTAPEVAAFEADPVFAAAIAPRRADDAGKAVRPRVPPLASSAGTSWWPMWWTGPAGRGSASSGWRSASGAATWRP
ncbi:hypothetical protein ACGFX8_16280 [Streptomyces sp. NPDC048362]|uniref:hypothetical protein n=1 Tax=Streptomyces sp. NPDC048362 TaxID=3365539 RepID=UPI00371BD4C5